LEITTKKINNPTARDPYRHGDLRRAGVVPNAAYRHFASWQELLLAVRAYTLSELAIGIENEMPRWKKTLDRPSLRAAACAGSVLATCALLIPSRDYSARRFRIH
jgi:AcrR family transcriptional regulator